MKTLTKILIALACLPTVFGALTWFAFPCSQTFARHVVSMNIIAFGWPSMFAVVVRTYVSAAVAAML